MTFRTHRQRQLCEKRFSVVHYVHCTEFSELCGQLVVFVIPGIYVHKQANSEISNSDIRIHAISCFSRIVYFNLKCFLESNHAYGDYFYKSELPEVQITNDVVCAQFLTSDSSTFLSGLLSSLITSTHVYLCTQTDTGTRYPKQLS